MNYEERKNHLVDCLDSAERDVDDYRKILDKHLLKLPIETPILYSKITDIVEVFIKEGESYRHILGGDGRSSAYDERRTGLVAYISINEAIYLDRDQEKIVERYVKELYNPDDIKWK